MTAVKVKPGITIIVLKIFEEGKNMVCSLRRTP